MIAVTRDAVTGSFATSLMNDMSTLAKSFPAYLEKLPAEQSPIAMDTPRFFSRLSIKMEKS